jgi:peroxiredoxin
MEPVNGIRCIKLVGEQKSDDWDKPRADSTAWRRQDTVWLSPRGGFAQKVERTIERRDAAHRDVGHRLVVKYELESSLQYPAQLYEDRRKEITQIKSFSNTLAPLLPRAAEIGPRPFETILERIKKYSDNQSPTPYREAIRHVQRLAEAGKRGETPPDAGTGDPTPIVQVAAMGRPAPDFLSQDLASHESARLRHWLGQPVLLVFYNPDSSLGEDVLRFAQTVRDSNDNHVAVVGLSVSDDNERALEQKADLKLTFPILSGTGLRLSYGVEATPKLVVIDAAGTVRGSYIGWGPETPTSIADDLQRCQTLGK